MQFGKKFSVGETVRIWLDVQTCLLTNKFVCAQMHSVYKDVLQLLSVQNLLVLNHVDKLATLPHPLFPS